MEDTEFLTRSEVSKMLKVSYRTLQRWENKRWIEVVEFPGAKQKIKRYNKAKIMKMIRDFTNLAK